MPRGPIGAGTAAATNRGAMMTDDTVVLREVIDGLVQPSC